MKDYSWKPSWSLIARESDVHPHCREERAELFDVADGGSTEYEVLNFIHSVIRVIKPQLILETGAYKGLGTIALAHACKLNGFGKVHSIENDPVFCDDLRKVLQREGLSDWAEVIHSNSLQFISNSSFVYDLAFLDSETSIRPNECELLMDGGRLKSLAVFHDTSPYRSVTVPYWTLPEVQEDYRRRVFELSKRPECTGYYDSPISRGFIALWMKT
jgi:predicted O-methyltransferase YrrM